MEVASPATSTSREATPASASSASASSHTVPLSASTSADAGDMLGAGAGAGLGMSGIGSGSVGAGAGAAGEDTAGDIDRFIRRMEMEKLQQRLELASVKANNGWSEMSIGEIESQLPPRSQTSPSSPRFDMHASAHGGFPPHPAYPPPPPGPSSSSHGLSVSPSRSRFDRAASPSRPLHDRHERPGSPYARQPLSPSSPRRRRMDEHLSIAVSPRGAGGGPAARRASSSAASGPSAASLFPNDPAYPLHAHAHAHSQHAHAGSPLSPLRREFKKPRSQSHSYRARPSTQDVDAARALTSMLGAQRGPASPRAPAGFQQQQQQIPAREPRSPSHVAPPLRASASLDSAPGQPGQRAGSGPAPTAEAGSMDGRGDDDKAAVELMMFLAQSPGASPRAPDQPNRALGMGTAARVLFADGDDGGAAGGGAGGGVGGGAGGRSLELENAAGGGNGGAAKEALPGSKLAGPPIMAVDVRDDAGGVLGR